MDVGLSTQLTLDFLRIPSGTRGPEGPQGGFGKGSGGKNEMRTVRSLSLSLSFSCLVFRILSPRALTLQLVLTKP